MKITIFGLLGDPIILAVGILIVLGGWYTSSECLLAIGAWIIALLVSVYAVEILFAKEWDEAMENIEADIEENKRGFC